MLSKYPWISGIVMPLGSADGVNIFGPFLSEFGAVRQGTDATEAHVTFSHQVYDAFRDGPPLFGGRRVFPNPGEQAPTFAPLRAKLFAKLGLYDVKTGIAHTVDTNHAERCDISARGADDAIQDEAGWGAIAIPEFGGVLPFDRNAMLGAPCSRTGKASRTHSTATNLVARVFDVEIGLVYGRGSHRSTIRAKRTPREQNKREIVAGPNDHTATATSAKMRRRVIAHPRSSYGHGVPS